jgi:hypothetical protein
MSKLNGFLQLRRGIFEHVRDGRMSHMDALTLIYIAAQADTRTGVWHGSAGALAGELALSSRNARRVLERLTERQYIKRFPVPGRHVCYPILVHKFLVTDGEHRGQHLNAPESTSSSDLRYAVGEHQGEQTCAQSAPQKRIENVKERRKKNLAAKPAPPADPRFHSFVNFAFGVFEQKHGQKPTWTGRDFRALSVMLASNKSLDAAELERRFRSYLASTEAFTAKQGDSLAYFCTHPDSFLSGPVLEPRKAGNGGQTSSDLAIQNARALGLGRPN